MSRAYAYGQTAFKPIIESGVHVNRQWPGYKRASDYFDAAEGANTNTEFKTISPIEPRVPDQGKVQDNDG